MRVHKKSPVVNSGRNVNSSSNYNGNTAFALQQIQASLDSINSRLSSYDTLVQNVEAIKGEIWEEDGINKFAYVSEQSEHNSGEIENLRCENDYLRKQVDLLRAVVIRMDRRMDNMSDEIIDLKSRSMRDNILIHNYVYTPNENLAVSMPVAIKENLGVDVEFVRIHRNGMQPHHGGRPISITAKLADRDKKQEILSAQKLKKSENKKLPFSITAQEPVVRVEERRRTYEKSDSFRSQNIHTKVHKNNIIMPNGDQYADEIPLLTNSEVLQITQDQVESLETVQKESTDIVRAPHGAEFFATGAKVQSVAETQSLYKQVCLDPFSASANHRILVYRFKDNESDKICENYHDDGEHGAGRRLLTYMKDNQILNTAIVVTKWSGSKHIGPLRHQIMEDLVCDISNILDNN